VRTRILLAGLYAQNGRRDDALREAEIAIAFDPDDPGTLLNAGCVYALFDMKTEALAVLRRAFQNGYWHADILERDPDYDSLRGEPDFQHLVSEMKARGSV
jgi:Flp pilus assembly protein TadD